MYWRVRPEVNAKKKTKTRDEETEEREREKRKKDLECKWRHSDLLIYITEHTSDFSNNWGSKQSNNKSKL